MYNLYEGSDRSLYIRRRCEMICEYIIDNRCSIRQASQNLMIPKSTVHSYIHSYIKSYYYIEYNQIMNILKYNKKYRGKPRKYWSK